MSLNFFKKMFKSRKNRKKDLEESFLSKTFTELNIRVGSSVTMDTSEFLLYNSSLDHSKVQPTETVKAILVYEVFGLTVNRIIFNSNNFLQIVKMEDGMYESMYFTESFSIIPDEWDDWLGDEGIMEGDQMEDNDGNLYEKAWEHTGVLNYTGNITNSTCQSKVNCDTMLFYRNIASKHDSEEQTDELLLVEASDGTRLSVYVGLEIDYYSIKIL